MPWPTTKRRPRAFLTERSSSMAIGRPSRWAAASMCAKAGSPGRLWLLALAHLSFVQRALATDSRATTTAPSVASGTTTAPPSSTVPVQTTAAPTTSTDPLQAATGLSNTTMVLIIVAIVMVLLLGVLLAFVRNRRRREPPPNVFFNQPTDAVKGRLTLDHADDFTMTDRTPEQFIDMDVGTVRISAGSVEAFAAQQQLQQQQQQQVNSFHKAQQSPARTVLGSEGTGNEYFPAQRRPSPSYRQPPPPPPQVAAPPLKTLPPRPPRAIKQTETDDEPIPSFRLMHRNTMNQSSLSATTASTNTGSTIVSSTRSTSDPKTYAPAPAAQPTRVEKSGSVGTRNGSGFLHDSFLDTNGADDVVDAGYSDRYHHYDAAALDDLATNSTRGFVAQQPDVAIDSTRAFLIDSTTSSCFEFDTDVSMRGVPDDSDRSFTFADELVTGRGAQPAFIEEEANGRKRTL